jgi:RNA polymerase sigma factor (sigma-70 family)
MEDHWEARGRLWVSGAGKRKGKATEATNDLTALLGTAQRTWHRAFGYAARHLGDSARAAELVEEVADSAAKAQQRGQIQNPDSYLFSGVVRRVRRSLEKDSRIEYVGSAGELTALEATQDNNAWLSGLEDRILAREVLDLVDERDRNILLRWSRGDEWEEIAEILGTTVNGAQCRLRRALERVRERVLGSKNAKSKPLLEARR